MAETKVFGITINTDFITKIPESYKIAAGAIVAIAILAGGGYYFSYPVYEEYTKLLDENQKLADENKTNETKLGFIPPNRYKAIEVVQAEKAELEVEIKKLQDHIPSSENIPTLLYDLENIVEVNNKSDLFDITPSALSKVSLPPNLNPPKPIGLDLSQVSLNLTLESNYPNLINLFKDFERYYRSVATSNISLSPMNDNKSKFNVLKATLNLKAYVLPEGGK